MTRNGSQPRGWRRVAVCSVAAAASAVLLAAAPPDGCPVPRVSSAVALQLAIRDASVRAETVAPSAGTNAVSTSKHRAVRPPKAYTNPIDVAVFAKMSKDGIAPTTRSSDAEFLRRVTLDLTGQLPDPATVTAFLADATPDKRTRTIDGLLASDAFNDRWTMWFGDLVQNVQVATNSREYYVGRNTYYSWIRSSIQQGKPYDQMVREVIGAQGDSFAAGNANYVVRQLQPNGPPQDTYDNLAAHAGEKFLGMPFLCISCHNGVAHLEPVNTYLAKKTRLDFWKAAAFFAKTTARPTLTPEYGNNVRKFLVSDNPLVNGYTLNTKGGNKSDRVPPVGQGNTVTPAFLFTAEQPRVGEPWRDAYGRMLTADPQFARATVNYLWKEMFGLGIVEPDNNIDPYRLDPNSLAAGQTVQPINPELLVALTTNFQQGGYSLRSILRLMVTSDTYQLSSRYTAGVWNEAWTTYFARHYPRRLTAEEIADAVAKATSVPMTMNVTGMGTMSKAMSLPDPTEPGARSAMGLFLNSFGRGNRDDVMRSEDSSITQALSMMNDSTVTSRIKQGANGGNSTVGKALKASTDPATIADTLYMATLSRHPTAAESAAAVTYLKSGTLSQKTEDLQYVLLNQLEFLFD
jgi:hypothetical protein